MSITEAQRKERKNHLGSSDMPAIMGFSRWANRYDVWLEKTGRVQPKEKKTKNITAGNLLELPIITWLSDYLNEPIEIENDDPATRDTMERKVDGTPIVVHLDGKVVNTGDPVEVKTEGVDHPIIEPWGEAGTDEVPEYTCIQAHCHLMATDHEICHVPTFLGGRGFGYFFVKRDNRIVELIKRTAIDFWENNVLKDVPPENVAPSLAMAKRIHHIEGEPKKLSEKMVKDWLDARTAFTTAEKVKEFHHAGLLAELDGIGIGVYKTVEDGKTVTRYVTNYEQTRKSHSVKESTFRVLRPKKDLLKKRK